MANSDKSRLWFPRSVLAFWMFVLLFLVALAPAGVAFVMAWIFSTGCFLTCSGPQPVAATVTAVIGAVVLLLPFAGVRFLQGRRPESLAVRVVVLLTVVAAAYYAGRLVLGGPLLPF